jgi:diguanylate cyclase (GGDEF)-like protein
MRGRGLDLHPDPQALAFGRPGAARVSDPSIHPSIRARLGVRRASLMLAAFALALAVTAMSVGVVLSRNASKAQILTNLKARGVSSAGFVSAFIAQQAARESEAGERLLAGRRTSDPQFRLVLTSLGSQTAVLLDRRGRLLDVAPSDPTLLGSEIAPHYAHLTKAVAGHVAVSGVVRSASEGKPVVAVAVPYQTSQGRRVLSVAYPVAGSVLSIFVEHASTLRPHHVMLVDADGRIIASSPSTRATTLGEVDRGLERALAGASIGRVTLAGMRSTVVVAPVAGTPWRLVMASPDSKLFASIGGWAKWLPWIVVALVALLGLVVLGLLLRSNAERVRLAALSRKLAEAASTDALTGLANRRSLQAQLAQASAFATRYREMLSVLMIDLDHFKRINDAHGHEAGDTVLVAVAEAMRHVFRDSDIFGRWGGDEFLAVLPNTDATGALEAGQRLCERVREIDIAEHDLLEPITLSVGCTAAIGGEPSDLINEADNSLFEAKRAGRSRVSVA